MILQDPGLRARFRVTLQYSKVLVIGSNSFSGSNFINYSLSNLKNVVGISRSDEYNKIMLPYKFNQNLNKFKFYKLDVNKHINKILDLVDNFKPEVVINFSAQGEVRNSWMFPEQWYATNCISIVNMTSKMVKRKFIRKYISVSTPEVYGNTKKNLIENHNYYPSTPYAASKLAGDLHLITLFKKYNFPVIFSRSANIYGPCQQLYRIIPRTIIFLKMRKEIELHAKGKTKRSFIHIKDVVNAICNLIDFGNIGQVYHIAPQNNEISIYNLVKLICNMMGCDFMSSVKLITENYGQDSLYSLNSDKIRNETSWSEKISFEEGINDTIKWISDNWEIISNMPHEYIHNI